MPRSRSRRDTNLRLRIAYIAARMMAEDGIADFGTAKNKAARQAGLSDANLLPDNHEIEAALREYQELYQKDDQAGHVRGLREIALKVMRDFAAFRPVLVGSVLSGTAGQYSDVNLQLFTDDPKALTMFLLNRRMRFEEGTRRVRRGDSSFDVPQVRIEVDGGAVTMAVLGLADERSPARARPNEELQRARVQDLEMLLGERSGESGAAGARD
jgi:hypothetical protein